MRQLPPHDQEPGACHDLTPQEKQEMDVFVTQYRQKALGVGNVGENAKVKVWSLATGRQADFLAG